MNTPWSHERRSKPSSHGSSPDMRHGKQSGLKSESQHNSQQSVPRRTQRGLQRAVNVYTRFRAFLEAHKWIGDTFSALIFCFLIWGTFLRTESSEPGLIINYSAAEASTATLANRIFSALIALNLCLIHTFPIGSAFTFVGIVCFQLLLGPAIVPFDAAAVYFIYAAIRYGERKYTPLIIVLSYVMTVITVLVTVLAYDKSGHNLLSPGHIDDLVAFVFTGLMVIALPVTGVILSALWRRSRTFTAQMILEQTQALELSLAQQAQVARMAERARIARDMHDVVAHTLSIIIVQADAGRLAGAHNLQVAIHTMNTIVQQSTQALANMHSLLGVIQTDAEDIQLPRPHTEHAKLNTTQSHLNTQDTQDEYIQQSPHRTHAIPSAQFAPADSTTSATQFSNQHWYMEISQLIDQAIAAAPDSTFTRQIIGEARPDALSTQTAMCVYRVVQESLSNIRKHAGPRVHTIIREQWDSDTLNLQITDNGRGISTSHSAPLDATRDVSYYAAQPQASHGFGLLGMRERVQACGGTVTSGPRLEGGFAIHFTLPLHTIEQAAPQSQSYPLTTQAASGTSTGVSIDTSTTISNGVSTDTSTRAEAHNQPHTQNPSHQSLTQPIRALGHTLSSNITQSSNPNHSAHQTPVPQTSTTAGTMHSWWHKQTQTISEFQEQFIENDPFQPTAEDTKSNSIVTKVANWTSKHYMVVDTLTAVVILLFSEMVISEYGQTHPNLHILFALLEVIPLVFRRRLPEVSAAAIGGLLLLNVAVSMLNGTVWNPATPFIAILSLYSVILYGRPRAVYWVYPLTVVGSIAAGLNLAAASTQFFHAVDTTNRFALLLVCALDIGMVLMTCIITIISAHITKSRNTNLWVLQARQEAMRQEEEQRVALAANTERNHIAAAIQQEVTDTLSSVIIQAQHGLHTLTTMQQQQEFSANTNTAQLKQQIKQNEDIKQSVSKNEMQDPETISETDATTIVQLFSDIAHQGRIALARMRELLRVLRDTSDTDISTATDHAPLRPIQH